jgi:hypothetical protein
VALDFNALALTPCIAEFGEPALYVPGAGPALRVFGIFNRYDTEAKLLDSGEFRQVTAPSLAINIADLPPGTKLPVKGEMIQLRHQTWEIHEPVSDNFGQLLLKLKLIR